ncbi:MAG TPA: hypothetical protein ENK18_26645 [Deltaproteobacteria bacterium]|nr:hypothetical protein [Deltaproteobacteria bacterium]
MAAWRGSSSIQCRSCRVGWS